MSDTQTSEYTNGTTQGTRRKLSNARLKARQAKSTATRAANKLANANGTQIAGADTRAKAPITRAARQRRPAQRASILTQSQQARAAPSSGLMYSLVEELPPAGSKMTRERATAWCKFFETGIEALYDMQPIRAAA